MSSEALARTAGMNARLQPEPVRPEWVRITEAWVSAGGWSPGSVVRVESWTANGQPVLPTGPRWRHSNKTFAPMGRVWEPAEPPRGSDTTSDQTRDPFPSSAVINAWTWWVVADDLVGGSAIATVNRPLSEIPFKDGQFPVANFIDEDTAKHIVGLHNAAIEPARTTADAPVDDPPQPAHERCSACVVDEEAGLAAAPDPEMVAVTLPRHVVRTIVECGWVVPISIEAQVVRACEAAVATCAAALDGEQ